MSDHTTETTPNEIPYSHCHCGCGQKTKIATRTRTSRGWVKGQPQPFIAGHKGTKQPRVGNAKRCTQCGQFKPVTTEYFFRFAQSMDGFKSQCKQCEIASNSRYRTENRDALQERQRRQYAENKERRREQGRRYHEKNREKRNESVRRYKARNKQKMSELNRRWKIANKEAVSANERRRNARKRNATGNHTTNDVKRQYEMQDGRCLYCGCEVGDTYEVDHIIPLSRGGSNDPENIAIACPSCNSSKGTKLLSEWAKIREIPNLSSVPVGN